MSGTVRTINFLQTQQAQDGQAAGSYTLSRLRDVIATVGARTGTASGTFVRVTDPEFGADSTGVVDSTIAFQNAMAAGPTLVPALQANGSIAKYTLSNCVVPSGAVLIGCSAPGYLGGGIASDVVMRPVIQAAGTATRVFNVDGKKNILIEGLQINGVNTSTGFAADGISAGSMSLVLKDCLFIWLNHGLGGAVAGSTGTFPGGSWVTTMINCNFQQCLVGIGNLVDSWVIAGSVSECTNGIVFDDNNNSGAINLIGVRIEWNGRPESGNGALGYGLLVSNFSNTINVTACQFDANGNAAIHLTGGAGNIAINGCIFQQNGNNVVSGTTLIGTSSHIRFNTCNNVTMTGNISNVRNASGVWAPAAFASFAGTNTGLVITGNDMSGYQGSTVGGSRLGPQNSATTWKIGTAPTSTTGQGLNAFILSKNLGTGAAANDVDSR